MCAGVRQQEQQQREEQEFMVQVLDKGKAGVMEDHQHVGKASDCQS
jgi:hypothetical protein